MSTLIPIQKSAPSLPSLYRRQLPASCVAFNSTEGRALFAEAHTSGLAEAFFLLCPVFQTQAEPAYCGLGSLAVVLNALEVDPGRVWKRPWRWYDESMLDCCVPLSHVVKHGVTIPQVS